MARYIDANKLIKSINRQIDKAIAPEELKEMMRRALLLEIENTPTVPFIDISALPIVDNYEIVRCKDCIHYWKNYPTEVAVCLASPRDDAYCSEGERKEE